MSSSPMVRRLASVVALALLLAPALAQACPACLGNPRNMGVIKLLAVLIVSPFVVVGVVLRAIRREAGQ